VMGGCRLCGVKSGSGRENAVMNWEGSDPRLLRWAADGGHTTVVSFLIREVGIPSFRRVAECYDTVLHAACRNGHAETVRGLLELGAPNDVARLCPWDELFLWLRRRPRLGEAIRRSGGSPQCRIQALGEAALIGSLRCVLLLLPICDHDTGVPSAVALAAVVARRCALGLAGEMA
jgi:ankyrin repeat protein